MLLATGSLSSVQSGPDGGAAGTHASVTGPHIYFWDINHAAFRVAPLINPYPQVHHERTCHREVRKATLSEFPRGKCEAELNARQSPLLV